MQAVSTKPKVRLIIAGGRDLELNRDHLAWLRKVLRDCDPSEIVSGGARGADRAGEVLAKSLGLPVRVFPADWDAYGKRAGHLRNEQMAKYADAVALLPGGRGTDNMRENARRYGLKIYEYDDIKRT